MNTTIQTRIDTHTKQQAEQILGSLGLSLSQAVRLFLHQAIVEKGLPFRPHLAETPNELTAKAIKEVKEGNHSKAFSSVKELMEDLDD